MATFNEILEGGLNQALAKRLGMQTGAPAPSIAPEVMPVAVTMGDRVDHRFWQNDFLWQMGFNTGAAGGTFSIMQFRNPPGSNVLVVMDFMTIMVNAAGAVTVMIDVIGAAALADFGTAHLAQRRDTRIRLGAQPALRMSSTNAAGAAVSGTGGQYIGTTAPVILPLPPVVLAPGSAIQMGPGQANTGLVGTIGWSERPVVNGELP